MSYSEHVSVQSNNGHSDCTVSPAAVGVSCDVGGSNGNQVITVSTLSTAVSGTTVTVTWTFTSVGTSQTTYTLTRTLVIA